MMQSYLLKLFRRNDNDKKIDEKKKYHQGNYSYRQNNIEKINSKEGSLTENESIDPNKIEDRANINNLFK